MRWNRGCSAGENCSVTEIDRGRILFDAAFFVLAAVAFYRSAMLSLAAIAIIAISAMFFGKYRRSRERFYFDSFIDFLNMIQSGLTAGQSIDSAIRSAAELEQDRPSYAQQAARLLQRALQIGINGDELFANIETLFPIPESRRYTKMIQLSRTTGSSMSRITDGTLEKLYTQFRATTEAHIVMYQKQLEQRILCIAPLLVIFFVQYAQQGFLEMMYTTPTGIAIMTISFALLLTMKYVGERIIRSVG